jgi:hypothetical protein
LRFLLTIGVLFLVSSGSPLYEALQLSDFQGPPSGSYRSSFSYSYSGKYIPTADNTYNFEITPRAVFKQYESYIDPEYSFFLGHIQNEYLLNWIMVLDFKLQGEKLFIDLNRDWQQCNEQIKTLWDTLSQKYKSLGLDFKNQTDDGKNFEQEKAWTAWIEGRIADLGAKANMIPVPLIKE